MPGLQECDQDQGNAYLMFQQFGSKRILDDVGGCVGGRKRDRDNKIRGDEAEKDQHEQLPFPSREQAFEHRDRAFAVRTLLGDAAIDGKRS